MGEERLSAGGEFFVKMQLLILEKRTGRLWDAANCTQTATWTTNRTGSPGVFKFTLYANGGLSFLEGDTVRFSVDDQLQFYGWVFTKRKDRWGIIEVTCYDRLRYLKATASYAFYHQQAGDIVRQIAEDMQLTTGIIAQTGYAIPSLIEQETTCLDIIGSAVQQTLLNTGRLFVFYDDGNGLALQEAADMTSSAVIGEKSLLTGYTYQTDIDEQTYNSVKLVRPNQETGRADVFIAQDSKTIARWGLLQLYQSVDGDANDAQLKSRAQASLSYYNQRMRTLQVTSLGVPGLRAGQMVWMQVPDLGDIHLNQYVLLERVTHTFTNDVHTMEFDTLSL